MKIIITESQFNHISDTIQSELDEIILKYENLGVSCWIYYKSSTSSIEISSIKIKDKSLRRNGIGTALMGDLIQLADKYSLVSVLTPDGSETPISVLKRFYGKFDFVPNKGKHIDFRFRHSMIRKK